MMDLERVKYVTSLDYLDSKEAADLLRISQKEIYRLVNAELLPVTRIGRKLIFSRTSLDAFMNGTHYDPTPMTRDAKRALAN